MRLSRLRIVNYRVLRRVELGPLTAMTVLLGAPGSGKSTVLDALEFLNECSQEGLGRAWERRHGAGGLVSRDADGPLEVGLSFISGDRTVDYRVAVDERDGRPVVIRETIDGEALSRDSDRMAAFDPDCEVPGSSGVREFVAGWRVFRLSASALRQSRGGDAGRLDLDGHNLAEVVASLQQDHPKTLDRISSTLGRRIPHASRVHVARGDDGRVFLMVVDRSGHPVPSRFVDSGTLVLLSYLVALSGPVPPTLAGLRDPERNLHPRLLSDLADDLRCASERTQLVVTTHSPQFLDGLRPEEVWVMDRGADGYGVAVRASDLRGVREFVQEGASLGQLWTEGYLELER